MNDERNESRMARIIRSYGADPRRWPEAAAAESVGPELSASLAEEAALDRLLDADARTAPAALPAALRSRLLDQAPSAPSGRRMARPVFAASPRWRAAAVAVALVGGTAIGYAGAAAAFSPPAPEQTLLGVALSAPDDPFAAFTEDEA